MSATRSAPRADAQPLFFESLRWRLTVWYALAVGALLLVFALVVLLGAQRVLYVSAAERIEAVSSSLQSYSRAGNTLFGSVSIIELLSEQAQLDTFAGSGLYIEAFNQAGARIGASTSLADTNLPISGYRPWRYKEGSGGDWGTAETALGPVLAHWHVVYDNGRPVATVYVAQSLVAVRQALTAFATFLVLSFLGALALIVASGVWLARSAIGPINEISGAVADIGSDDLTKRLNWADRRDEVGRLAARFDDMLTRLEAAFMRERRFISDASHELKTPLTVINANAQMLERWGDKDAEVRREALEAIRAESAQMARVINAMLTLAKTDNNDALAFEPLNMRPLVDDVAGSLRSRAAEKGLTLETQCAADAYVLGEPGLLRQLVVNLTENAIKFTEHGGVRISVRAENSHAHLDVADTGPGIPKDALPHVFERFYRADPAHSRTVEGTGLGLAVVSSIVRAHGGEIAVKSAVGEGTTVSVTLPALALADEGEP